MFPFRFIPDLSIGWKLGASILGAPALLPGVSWFALDRMAAIGAMRDEVVAQVAVDWQVRESLPAAGELRVASASSRNQQTVNQVKAVRERAEQQHGLAKGALAKAREVTQDAADRARLDSAIAGLDAVWDVVKRQADLRRDMVIGRQRNLFQARPTFESALNTLIQEVAAGQATRGGVDSVREGGAVAAVEANGPGTKEIAEYRLAMNRVLSGAVMFMATANGAAANEVREASALAAKTMAALLAGETPDAVKADARTVDTLGRGIALSALELLDQTKRLETMRTEDMAQASQAMREAVGQAVAAFAARVSAASARSVEGQATATWTMTVFIGVAAILMVVMGAFIARLIAAPIARLTREVRRIADGDIGAPVLGVERRDEAGLMAEAVERLRGAMRQAFLQARMIDEIPLELQMTALHDRHGAYAGPMAIWRHLTDQTLLAARFEQSIGSIARTVGEAAAGMRDAARIMTDAAGDASIRTYAVTVASEQAAGHVATAAAGAEELAVSVNEIGRQVAESSRIAARAVTEAQATDRSVGGLSEAAAKIGEVVDLIGDIAARTNLLALNATIEAARAGEAGKGFAVVASEVKNLATQTAKATEGISAQIAAMRGATGQAAEALRSIGGTIQRMNEIALAIAGAVEEQGAATREIARAVQQAAMGTTEVNGNIAVVNDAVAGTGQRAGDVLVAATELTGQADALKNEVSAFLADMRQAV